MTAIKPSSHGIVVENKESGLRYASTDANYDPKTERKVRDLRVGESVLSYGFKEARPTFGQDNDSTDEDETDTDDQPVAADSQ